MEEEAFVIRKIDILLDTDDSVIASVDITSDHSDLNDIKDAFKKKVKRFDF